MEFIYIAKSNSFPGVVKIGRTDVSVDRRMEQLSDADYGPTGFSGDSDWEAISAFVVKDNVSAERLLHEIFENARVESGRELFYSDDPAAMAEEARKLVNGTYVADAVDGANAATVLADLTESLFSASAVIFTVHALFPNKTTDDLISRKDEIIEILESKYRSSKTIIPKIGWGAAAFLTVATQAAGAVAALPVIGVVDGIKDLKKKQQIKFKHRAITAQRQSASLASTPNQTNKNLPDDTDLQSAPCEENRTTRGPVENQKSCIVGASLAPKIKRQLLDACKRKGLVAVREYGDEDDAFWSQMTKEGFLFEDQKLLSGMPRGPLPYKRRGDSKKD